MVKRTNTSILPRITQQLTPGQESAFGQESRLLKSSLMIDPVKTESLTPRFLMFFLSSFLFTTLTYTTLTLISYLRYKQFLKIESFFYFYFVLLALSFISGFIYQRILKLRNISLVIYASIYAYSMIYLPVPMIFEEFISDISFIFYFAVAMISQYWITNVLTQGVVFSNNKNRFLFQLATFILQFAGVILIGKSIKI